MTTDEIHDKIQQSTEPTLAICELINNRMATVENRIEEIHKRIAAMDQKLQDFMLLRKNFP